MTRLTLALLGAMACTTFTTAADPPASLDGTWVRELAIPDSGGGMQAILTFKGDRLTARFVECGFVDGGDKLKSGSFEFECSYHRSADGYVVGRVIGFELDLKNMRHERGGTPETFKWLNKFYGEPFCFRCDVRNGVLTVADLRLPMPEGYSMDPKEVREWTVAIASGKYKKSETANVPLPNVERRKYEPPKMEKTMNGIRVIAPFVPHPDLPMTVRATPGPLPGLGEPLLPRPPRPPQSSPTLLPTAGMLLPPGSMKNAPMLPMVKDAWKQSTAPTPQTIPPSN